MISENLNHFKSVTAYQLFVEPADQNYLLSRWMLANGFYPDYFWQTAQAVEKYLKAGLAVNNIPVRQYGHHLPNLYDEHRRVFGDLALSAFRKPDDLATDFWRNEDVERFITRINTMGDPDTRYGMLSWSRRPDDLFKMDQLCWHLRRLTIGLDWIVGADFPVVEGYDHHNGSSYCDAMASDPEFLPRGLMRDLDRPLFHFGDTRADILYSWNFEFERDADDRAKSAPGTVSPQIGPMRNSHLYLYWRILSDTDDMGRPKALAPVFREGMKWLIKTVLQGETKSQVQAALDLKRPAWNQQFSDEANPGS